MGKSSKKTCARNIRTGSLTKTYRDIVYQSPDGLALYARDYGGNGPALLCMHGLTRNSADFHDLALHLRGRFRVISVDQRGRGRSAYDPTVANYRPDVYCADMLALLGQLNLSSVIVIGTSMGALMTMMMAASNPGLFSAAVINDIGPEIDPAGLKRIAGYVGKTAPFENWAAAANVLKAQGPDVFPKYSEAEWMDFARRTCVETDDGRVRFNYDPAIAEPFNSDDTVAAPPDMWPLYEALNNIPVLVIRGATSDILAPETAQKMVATHPNAGLVTIPNIGHAPMLTEPESLAAIDAFLESLS